MSTGALATWIIVGYLASLIVLGLWSARSFRGTAADYFVASRGLGSVLLLLSIFGTTMTAFAMQGSSGEAWSSGIGVFGKMASWSAIVHSACFFLIGIKLWSLGQKYNYQTQIQFFRDRFESSKLGLLLFPILAGLVMVYILTGVIGAGTVIEKVTVDAFPTIFPSTNGGVPYWLGTATICGVVLLYVLLGGARGTAWANAFQTVVFVAVGIITFIILGQKLGGFDKATQMVRDHNPTRLMREVTQQDMAEYEASAATAAAQPPTAVKKHKPKEASKLEFLSYGAIPLSVAMFPHLFQLWLTARTAKKFRLTVVAHPILIMVVWLPCVLIGVWATSAMVGGNAVIPASVTDPNSVLALMVRKLCPPFIAGLLAAGILAAILGGLDAQFLCVGTMFTHDIVAHYRKRKPLTDSQLVSVGRWFVVLVVVASYGLAVTTSQRRAIFHLGVWCFSGFAALFPLVFASLYWKGVTKAGAYASVLTAGATWVWFFFGAKQGSGGELLVLGMAPAATIVAASAVSLVIVSLMTRPPSQATIDKFFAPQRGEMT